MQENVHFLLIKWTSSVLFALKSTLCVFYYTFVSFSFCCLIWYINSACNWRKKGMWTTYGFISYTFSIQWTPLVREIVIQEYKPLFTLNLVGLFRHCTCKYCWRCKSYFNRISERDFFFEQVLFLEEFDFLIDRKKNIHSVPKWRVFWWKLFQFFNNFRYYLFSEVSFLGYISDLDAKLETLKTKRFYS